MNNAANNILQILLDVHFLSLIIKVRIHILLEFRCSFLIIIKVRIQQLLSIEMEMKIYPQVGRCESGHVEMTGSNALMAFKSV